MSRKVLSLSLSPELLEQFSTLAKVSNKSQSELFRELIIERAKKQKERSVTESLTKTVMELVTEGSDLVIVVALAIVRKGRKVLIISRKSDDPIVKNLKWAFPGGRVLTFDLRSELESILTDRIGGTFKVGNPIGARVVPESEHAEQKIVAVYFAVEPRVGKIQLNKEFYTDYEWVEPLDVFKFFTSSTPDEVTRYLDTISGRE